MSGSFLRSLVFFLQFNFLFSAVWADDDTPQVDDATEREMLAIFSFKHDLSGQEGLLEGEVEGRVKLPENLNIPAPVRELFLELLDRASGLKNEIGEAAFNQQVKENSIYILRKGVGRAELTTLNGSHRIRVVDQTTGESWFFFMEDDDISGSHAEQIRSRQWIMSGTNKSKQRAEFLKAEYERQELRWYQFFKRARVRGDLRKNQFENFYLPGRDTNFTRLKAQSSDSELTNDSKESFEVVSNQRYERPFKKVFMGIGYPLIPWWKAYSGALKSKLDWRLGAVCASIQVTMTCGIGYAKDALDKDVAVSVLGSLEWQAMLLSAFFGGGIGLVAGTYKEWVRLGGEVRQWIKLMSVGGVFGYIFAYFVKYNGDASAFNIFDSNGDFMTTITLASGATIGAGIFAHGHLLLNNLMNQFSKRELYEYAHIRREMRLDIGNHEKGIFKGSSKSNTKMQMLYQILCLTKLVDLANVLVPLAFIGLSGDLALGKAILLGAVPGFQLWNIFWTRTMMMTSNERLKPLWKRKYDSSVSRFWHLSGLPFLPLKFAYDAARGNSDTFGGKAGQHCLAALKNLKPDMSTHRPIF